MTEPEEQPLPLEMATPIGDQLAREKWATGSFPVVPIPDEHDVHPDFIGPPVHVDFETGAVTPLEH